MNNYADLVNHNAKYRSLAKKAKSQIAVNRDEDKAKLWIVVNDNYGPSKDNI